MGQADMMGNTLLGFCRKTGITMHDPGEPYGLRRTGVWVWAQHTMERVIPFLGFQIPCSISVGCYPHVWTKDECSE